MAQHTEFSLRADEEFIELYKILKAEGLCQDGAQAKIAVADGQVIVNGEVETRKRKKIYAGDRIEFAGNYIVVLAEAGQTVPQEATEMQFPADDNGEMLKAMADAGMDLTKSMNIDFFLVFDERSDAESVLEDLTAKNDGAELELQFNEEVEKWEIIASYHMVPEYDAIIAKETELNSFAGEFDGMTDGWGVMQHQEGDEFAGDDEHDHECDEHCHH